MPRDGTATRERILAAAERLVIDNGFAATSVDQVIAESQTSKGAFFHHFASKQALADALVARYVEADLQMLEGGLAAARAIPDGPIARAVGFLAYYEDHGDEIMTEATGCLYASVLVERQLIGTGTSDPIRDAVGIWRRRYVELLREALGESPDVDGDVDVPALADHVFVTFEGAFLLARATGEPEHMRRQLGVLRHLVQHYLSSSLQPAP